MGDTGTLGVAIVGVVGTLLSALLTRRAADRSRQRERERAQEAADRRQRERQLRASFVALNAAARQYLAVLTDQLHALGNESELPDTRQRLAEARDHFREVYAEAQVRVPEPVLGLTGRFSRELGEVYGMVRRLDGGVLRPGDAPEAARERIAALWTARRRIQAEMRFQLGVSRSDAGR
ncbi:hypothetical protein AB0O31_22105 [Kitasatospora cineracea]|uniref:hypothetical protein n=1 Tax=Kitasatospora cineracea TaxID=88074 RepID=UPI0034273624